MTPYEDADLAALVLGRALVSEEQLRQAARRCASAAPRSDALARALVETGALPQGAVDALRAELGAWVAPCEACARPFCALPGERPRRVPCPGCGRERPVDARRGVGHTAVVTSSDLQRLATKEPPLLPGQRVGPYEVEREISRGAMGVVLRARHLGVEGRLVALKVMQGDVAQDPEGLKRFQREGEVLASLDHAHIVRVWDAGRLADGRPYLAMDYVEGTTLEALAKKGPVPLERAARLIEVVARAVAYMNARGVVHRDLKLGNVLLDAAGVPRIADFGLAWVEGARTKITQAGDLLGTPLYMAPELVLGKSVDGRIDVYALGVMVFRLITGSYPFYADSSVELFEKVLREPLRYPDELGPDARAVLERALARDRRFRYRDAEALADDLAALADGRPVKARPPGRLERVVRAVGTPARAALLAGVVLGVVALGAGALLARRSPLRRAEEEAERLARGLELQASQLGPLDDARAALARADALLGGGAPAAELDAWRATGGELRRAGADDDAAAALDAVRAARDRLGRALEQAELVEAVQQARARGVDAPGLVALLGRVLRTGGSEPRDPEFERAAGWVHLSCGQLEAARVALERGASGGAPDARSLAWARARLGQAAGAVLDGVSGDARTSAELVVALAAREPTLASSAAEAVADVPGDSARALLAARLAWDAAPARELPALLEHLARARAVSDPAVPASVPPVDRGHAALLEGQVLLALGWHASAERALARASGLVGGEPVPAVPVEVGGRLLLLAPATAALLLRARALAPLLDGPAALAAAEAAVERARLDVPPDALVEASALRAEALALLERHDDARAALADARAALGDGGGPLGAELSRTEARLALWAGRRAAPLTATDAERATAWRVEGEAELARAAPVDASKLTELSPDPRSPALPRARRAFALALSAAADAAQVAAAWAGTARVRLYAHEPRTSAAQPGELEAAQAAADAAIHADPDAWDALRARALVRAARGGSGAPDDLAGVLEVGVRAPGRPFERWGRALPFVAEAVWALRLRGRTGQEVLVVDRAEALAAEDRLPPNLRSKLLAFGMNVAARDLALTDALEARLRRLKADTEPDVVRAKLAREFTDESVFRDPRMDAALRELLVSQPCDATWYELIFTRGEELREGGFDCLALAFELHPGIVPNRANYQRQLNAGQRLVHAATSDAVPTLVKNQTPSKVPSLARDDDLRLAAAVMFGRELDVPLDPAVVLPALPAAERFVRRQPRSAAGWLTLGWIRLELGDAGGALVALERAGALFPPFEARVQWDGCWPHFYAALAHGALREWPEAAAALRRAAELDLWAVDRLRDPRLCEDRQRVLVPEVEALVELVKRNDAPRSRVSRGR